MSRARLRELAVLVVARREKREKEAATRPEKEGRFIASLTAGRTTPSARRARSSRAPLQRNPCGAAEPLRCQNLLGVLRYQQGRNQEELDHISAALKLNPNSAAALSNFGLVLEKLGRPADALASYDKALALKPNYAEALTNRGIALGALQRPADALASYDKALVGLADADRTDAPEAYVPVPRLIWKRQVGSC